MNKEIVFDSLEEGLLDRLKSSFSKKKSQPQKQYDEDFGTDYEPPNFKQFHPRVQKILIFLDNDVTPDGKKTKAGQQTLFIKRGKTLHRVYGAFSLAPSNSPEQAIDELKQILQSLVKKRILARGVADKVFASQDLKKESNERRNVIFFSKKEYTLKEDRYGKAVIEDVSFRILTDSQLQQLDLPNLAGKLDKVVPLNQANNNSQQGQQTPATNPNQQKIDNYFKTLLQYAYFQEQKNINDPNKVNYIIGIPKNNVLTNAIRIYGVDSSKVETEMIPELIKAIWTGKNSQGSTAQTKDIPLNNERLVYFKNYGDQAKLKQFFEKVVKDNNLKESLLRRWKLLANIK